MRNNTYNQARKIIKEAVKAVRNDTTRSPQPLADSVIPSAGTTAGFDGTTGEVYTVHVAITNIDKTNDPGAITAGW